MFSLSSNYYNYFLNKWNMNALLTALTQIAASEIAAVTIVKTVISDRIELSVTITERAG